MLKIGAIENVGNYKVFLAELKTYIKSYGFEPIFAQSESFEIVSWPQSTNTFIVIGQITTVGLVMVVIESIGIKACT